MAVSVFSLACLSASGAGTDAVACVPGTPLNAGDLNIFHSVSPPAAEIRELAWLVIAICGGIFVLVEGALVYAIVKFRARRTDAEEPRQVFGSTPIEMAWTIIPLIVVFVLALTTVRTIREVQRTEAPAGALEVEVIGHQWWWEYRVPGSTAGRTIVTANELVVPVGRPVWLRMSSADVIHSWWVPRLNGKTDLVPGHPSNTWFTAESAGVFLGQCAEYCGTQHANMLLRVRAVEEREFDAWRAQQEQPPVAAAEVSAGRARFLDLACANCHAIDGWCDGAFGPSLTHLMSRETLGAGVASMDAESLRAWIDDPQRLKPGCNMPSLKLSDAEVGEIVSFLVTLK